MSEISLAQVIEALETFLRADITIPLVHLDRIEASFLLDQLRRLVQFDENEKRWAGGRTGAGVTDCIGWLYLQKRNAEAIRDTAGNMEARMFQAIIDHLQELHGRREGADRAKAEERKKREEAAQKDREAKQRRYDQAKKGEEERRARYEQAEKERAEAFRNAFGGAFGFDSAATAEEMYRTFYGSSSEFWRSAGSGKSQGNRYDEAFRWNADGSGTREDPKQKRPPPRGKGKRPWYEVLGVQPNATRDQIRSAYRKLVAKHHPDRAGGSHEKMQEVNVARDEALAGLG